MEETLVAMFQEGTFTVPVHATFPLEQVADAVTLAEEIGGVGKVLLVSD
jgi:NADPH:quinone reductase-like Zn-dependent oxidoreductase